MENGRSFRVGDAVVHVFNTGMLRADLAEWFGVARDAGPEAYRSELAGEVSVPVHCVHVQCGATSLLVDACIYDLAPDSPHAIPGYEAPPSLVDQMTAAGIDVGDVDHVVITHAHFDHFNGLIEMKEGLPTLVYSGAQVYLGRADWESPEIQDALNTPGSVESRILGTLAELGKLTMVDGEIELADGITVFPSPGETPGHQSVRVESSGEVLYCIGDLYHHAVELVEPTWAVTWADGKTIASSRAALKRRIAGERVQLIATHILDILQSDAVG